LSQKNLRGAHPEASPMTRGTIRKEILPNGITLLTERMPHVRSVTVGVWLRRGSRHDRRPDRRLHFIDIWSSGDPQPPAREIAWRLIRSAADGRLRPGTCFAVWTIVGDAVDLLSDIVLQPLFDAKELERERKVIVEEIRMVEDAPEELVYDLFSTHFYPRHALGRPIQGTEDTVGGSRGGF
jgi:predicted Zn-dependent peptidase